MKNFIKANYNIYPSKIFKNGNKYFFFSGNEKIFIIKLNKSNNINEKINISNRLYGLGIPVSTFLLNNKKEYVCKKDDYYIMLLKYNDITDNQIYLEDIYKYDKAFNDINKFNIIQYWEETIDSIEMELTEYNKEYPLLQQSIDYFIGLSENAIELLNHINYSNNSLGHLINIDEYNRENYSNPLNIIKTNKMYDISQYYKYHFYNNSINYDELYVILNNIKDTSDLIFFYASMLFQENYFNCVKEIILNKKKEEDLYRYINNIKNYKELLKYIKSILHNISHINDIEWLDK